jgi:hypothetical protein
MSLAVAPRSVTCAASGALNAPRTPNGFGFSAGAGKSDYPRLAPKIRYHTKLENLIFNQRAAPSLSKAR